MSELETYLKYLDESSYDHRDAEKINSEFQKVYTSLHEKGEVDNAMLTDLNRQVFAVQKSFDTKFDESEGTAYGLSWQMSGVQTLEDGRQIPVYWPNVLGFNENNYEYF